MEPSIKGKYHFPKNPNNQFRPIKIELTRHRQPAAISSRNCDRKKQSEKKSKVRDINGCKLGSQNKLRGQLIINTEILRAQRSFSMSQKFSATLRIGDLNDYIAPSQGCVVSLKTNSNRINKSEVHFFFLKIRVLFFMEGFDIFPLMNQHEVKQFRIFEIFGVG